MANTLNNQDGVRVSGLLYLAELMKNYAADIATTCATLVANREVLNNKTTTISSASTDDQYPSAKAVYELIHSIRDANEVSY